MNTLKKIEIKLPKKDIAFGQALFDFLSHFGDVYNDEVLVHGEHGFSPKISLKLEYRDIPSVSFLKENDSLTFEITNRTNTEKNSPHDYKLISLTDFISRMKSLGIAELDHMGINLPWFEGIHPDLIQLREWAKQSSLYYMFPTGDPWDFILPGTEAEVESKQIDLSIKRRPKFEIVSFNKSSVPIIQIDFLSKAKYEQIKTLFPEGIPEPTIKDVWVYVDNSYDIDLCFVVHEYEDGDWSAYFDGHRLKVELP